MSPTARSRSADPRKLQFPVWEYLTHTPAWLGQIPIKSPLPSPSKSPAVICVAGVAICVHVPAIESR